jgi:alpha-D-ribose 1-methylphosphonate 5-triphosphate synthase subunit PhnH
LQGPGIQSERKLCVQGFANGFAAEFVAQWADNHASFPRGVDVFLITTTQIAGLSRTTRIQSDTES